VAEAVAWPDHPGATVDAVAFVEADKRYPQVDRDSVTDLSFADRQADRLGAFIDGFKRAVAMRAAPTVRGDGPTREDFYKFLDKHTSLSERTNQYLCKIAADQYGWFSSLPQSSAGEGES
jgi:hypothetical protein